MRGIHVGAALVLALASCGGPLHFGEQEWALRYRAQEDALEVLVVTRGLHAAGDGARGREGALAEIAGIAGGRRRVVLDETSLFGTLDLDRWAEPGEVRADDRRGEDRPDATSESSESSAAEISGSSRAGEESVSASPPTEAEGKPSSVDALERDWRAWLAGVSVARAGACLEGDGAALFQLFRIARVGELVALVDRTLDRAVLESDPRELAGELDDETAARWRERARSGAPWVALERGRLVFAAPMTSAAAATALEASLGDLGRSPETGAILRGIVAALARVQLGDGGLRLESEDLGRAPTTVSFREQPCACSGGALGRDALAGAVALQPESVLRELGEGLAR